MHKAVSPKPRRLSSPRLRRIKRDVEIVKRPVSSEFRFRSRQSQEAGDNRAGLGHPALGDCGEVDGGEAMMANGFIFRVRQYQKAAASSSSIFAPASFIPSQTTCLTTA